MKEYVKSIISELSEKSIIKISDIPDIDLYMDQVTTFIQDRLSAYKHDENDKILTKTMINNYAKTGLIEPPLKKKYSKRNIESLIMIFHLKYVLSMENIGALMKLSRNDDAENIYRIFTQIQENEGRKATEEADKTDFGEKDDKLLAAIFSLAEGAVLRKIMAEKLIEKYIENNSREDTNDAPN